MELSNIYYIAKHNPFLSWQQGDSIGENWYYINHIPKTAGTSLLYSIYDRFDANKIYPNAWDYYIKQKGRYLSNKRFKKHSQQYFPENKRILIGHYRAWPIDQLRSTKPKTICFLRDPVKRILSSIDYHRVKGRRYEGESRQAVITKRGDFEAQLQAMSLGYDATKDNKKDVFAYIDQIEAVCITEAYRKSIAMINALFGWNLEAGHRKNVQAKAPWPQELVDQITELCKFETELYGYALKKFEKLCGDLDITDT